MKSLEIEKKADDLKIEAIALLNELFRVQKGFTDLRINRVVECLISSTILKISAIHAEIIEKQNEDKEEVKGERLQIDEIMGIGNEDNNYWQCPSCGDWFYNSEKVCLDCNIRKDK